jgi:hypothetical protein
MPENLQSIGKDRDEELPSIRGWSEVFRSFRKAYPSLPDEIICRILRMPPEYLAYVPESNQEGKKDTGLKLEDSSSLKEGSKR